MRALPTPPGASDGPEQPVVTTSRYGQLAATVTLAEPDGGPPPPGLVWCARLEDPPAPLRHVRAGYGGSEQDALDALQWACERATQGRRGLAAPG